MAFYRPTYKLRQKSTGLFYRSHEEIGGRPGIKFDAKGQKFKDLKDLNQIVYDLVTSTTTWSIDMRYKLHFEPVPLDDLEIVTFEFVETEVIVPEPQQYDGEQQHTVDEALARRAMANGKNVWYSPNDDRYVSKENALAK